MTTLRTHMADDGGRNACGQIRQRRQSGQGELNHLTRSRNSRKHWPAATSARNAARSRGTERYDEVPDALGWDMSHPMIKRTRRRPAKPRGRSPEGRAATRFGRQDSQGVLPSGAPRLVQGQPRLMVGVGQRLGQVLDALSVPACHPVHLGSVVGDTCRQHGRVRQVPVPVATVCEVCCALEYKRAQLIGDADVVARAARRAPGVRMRAESASHGPHWRPPSPLRHAVGGRGRLWVGWR